MKKIYIVLLVIASMLSLTSCEGLLNLKPDSEITYAGYWDNPEGVNAAHIGIYNRFRGYGGTFWTLGEVRSDLYGGKTIETSYDQTLIDNEFSELKAPYGGNFADFYGFIHNLNDFIANAPKSAVMASQPARVNNMMAQVHGIRAFVYYTMVKTWGDVVISTSPADGEFLKDEKAQKRKRAPKEEVMAQVLSDIETSLKYYAEAGSDTWNGGSHPSLYWSKNATLILKGDALLWKGEVLNGGAADFKAAKEALEQVKGQLVEYERLWGVNNETNAEFILAFDFKKDQASHWYSQLTARAVDITKLVNYDGHKISEYGLNGGSRYGVSQSVVSKFYTDPDKRRDTFVLMFNPESVDAENPIDPFNLASKAYQSAFLSKFQGQTDEGGIRRYYENIPVYRYADAVLLLAEAKNQLGEDPSAEINMIRKRAGIDGNYIPYTNQSKIDNKRAILDERLKEFAGEGKRWWDLVRAGDDLVFDYVTKLKKENRHMIYLPLSNSLMSKDPEYITQTEGY